MIARLVSYSQPTDMIGVDDIQELIAFSARVSNPSNQMNTNTNQKFMGF